MIGRLELVAAATAGAVVLAGQVWAPRPLRRRSAAGRDVSLIAGPATVAGLLVGGAGSAAPTVAVAAAGIAGLLDDLADPAAGAGPAPAARGFAGHLAALRQGRVTTGVAKIVIIGLGSTAAAGMLAGRRGGLSRGRDHGRLSRWHRDGRLLGDAALIAATANLVNLFDTRPGRAGKAVLVGVLLAGNPPGVLGSLAATLPGDVGEHWMLGDAGANALGAALGLRVATVGGPARRAVWLVVVVALTVASERVSFGAVIERHTVLRAVDGLGRVGRR